MKEDPKIYFAIVKKEKDYFLVFEGKVPYMRPTREQSIKDFPLTYKKNPSENVLTTYLENINFQPSFVYLSFKDLEKKLFNIDEGVENYTLESAIGNITAWKCNGKANIESIYISGNPTECLDKIKNSLNTN